MRNIIIIITTFLFISCSSEKEKVSEDITRIKIEENQTDKNLNLTFQILAAIGSVATFGSFIYLFRRDKDKQAQIDRLANIVSTLSDLKDIENQKLNLSIRPDIKYENCGYQGQDGEWHLDIINVGEKATLTKLELICDGLILHNEHIPYVMEKDATRKIFARTNTDKHVKDCEYELKIYHTDKIGNLHISIFEGKGERAKLKETKNCV